MNITSQWTASDFTFEFEAAHRVETTTRRSYIGHMATLNNREIVQLCRVVRSLSPLSTSVTHATTAPSLKQPSDWHSCRVGVPCTSMHLYNGPIGDTLLSSEFRLAIDR